MTIEQVREGMKYKHIDDDMIAEVWAVQPAENGVMEVWFFSNIIDCSTHAICEVDRMPVSEFNKNFKEMKN